MKNLKDISAWWAEQIKPNVKSISKENPERDTFAAIFFNLEASNLGVTNEKITIFKNELEKALEALDTSKGIMLEPKEDNILGKIMIKVEIPLRVLKFNQLMYISKEEVVVQHGYTTEELVAA